jgi:LacI family transcriptional regulator
MKKSVTIKDIARIAGVHHTTVSLALRNSKALRKETIEKIQALAAEMGYRANLLAQGFRNRRSNTIGLLVPSIQHHFFAKFISEISELVGQTDYSVMVFQSNEKLTTENKNIEALIDNRVAGVIASVSRETIDASAFNAFIRENIPVVFFDRIPKDAIGAKVTVNNFQGGLDATNLFFETGRKRIAFITGSSHVNVYRERLAGYMQALKNNNCICCNDLLIEGGFLLEDGMAGAKQLMNLSEKPDAILAVGDDVAIGAIKYLKSVGIRIPEDMAVIGFDNDPMGIAIEPELTTVEQPVNLMAKRVLQLLFGAINADAMESEEEVLNPNILMRNSC